MTQPTRPRGGPLWPERPARMPFPIRKGKEGGGALWGLLVATSGARLDKAALVTWDGQKVLGNFYTFFFC